MAKGGIPVVLVDNGAPAMLAKQGIPITIVGSSNGSAAVLTEGQTVAMEDGSGNSLGNGTVHIVDGAVTVDWNGGGSGTPLEDGEPVNLDNHDGSEILAPTSARVTGGNLVGVILPQNYAVIQDGIGNFDVADFGQAPGVAVIARVTNNQPGVQLANGTTKIAINAAPITVVDQHGRTAGATIAVDQGAWQNFPLTNATDAVMSAGAAIEIAINSGTTRIGGTFQLDAGVAQARLPSGVSMVGDGIGLQVPVTGTYTNTITAQVDATGAITGFTLS